mmetsp:Transcript_22031/g.86622  ORF Transcript_22031/g.86622 Transcript_22031/m.86622 type:complete len:644 (+) Transcript_22031:965-2896(+)
MRNRRREHKEPRVPLLLASGANEELPVADGDLERPHLLVGALVLLDSLLADDIAALVELDASGDLLRLLVLVVGEATTGELEPALAPLLAPLHGEVSGLDDRVVQLGLGILQADDLLQSVVLLLEAVVQHLELVLEALVGKLLHDGVEVELLELVLEVRLMQIPPGVEVLEVLLQVVLEHIQADAGLALHDLLRLELLELGLEADDLGSLRLAALDLLRHAVAQSLQLGLHAGLTVLHLGKAPLAVLGAGEHPAALLRHRVGLRAELLGAPLHLLDLGEQLALLLRHGTLLGHTVSKQSLQDVDLVLEKHAVLRILDGLGAKVGDLGLKLGDQLVEVAGGRGALLELQLELPGLLLELLVEPPQLLALVVGARKLGLQIGDLRGDAAALALELALLRVGDVCVEEERGVQDDRALVGVAVEEILGLQKLRDSELLLSHGEGVGEVLLALVGVEGLKVKSLGIHRVDQGRESHAVVEAVLEGRDVHVRVALRHLAQPAKETILGGLARLVLDCINAKAAEERPQKSESQLKVAIHEILCTDSDKANSHVLLDAVQEDALVLNLVHTHRRLLRVPGELAVGGELEEAAELHSVLEILLNVVNDEVLLLDVRADPQPEGLDLDLLPLAFGILALEAPRVGVVHRGQ